MKRFLLLAVIVCVLISLVGSAYAQEGSSGPVVSILGEPVTDSNVISTYVSVVDPSSGAAITGLPADNFVVTESGSQVPATINQVTSGVAVVIVIDRGGIAWPGDPRIEDAYVLAEELLNRLDIGENPNGDMVAVIGIRGREDDDPGAEL